MSWTSIKELRVSVVEGVAIGFYENLGGGILVKFAVDGDSSIVLGFQAEMAFSLRSTLDRSIVEGYQEDNRSADVKGNDPATVHGNNNRQPRVTASDFQLINVDTQIVGWDWTVHKSRGIEVSLLGISGHRTNLWISFQFCLELLDSVQGILQQGLLIDLSEFRRKPLKEMEAEYAQSKGAIISSRLDYFQLSLDIFERNYQDFMTHVSRVWPNVRDENLIIWVRRHNQRLYLEELLRLLHNFLASCSTLVDHTRAFYRRYHEKSGDFSDYQTRVNKDFTSDPLSRFVSELRNLFLHDRPPAVGKSISLTERLAGSLHLTKVDLLQASAWKPKARQFIESQGDQIDLVEVTSTYHQKVAAFYRWFMSRQHEIHRKELTAAERMRTAILGSMSKDVVERLQRNLTSFVPATPHKLAELMEPVLSPRDLHELRPLETKPAVWMRRAVQIGSGRFYIPQQLRQELLALGQELQKESPPIE